MLKKGQREVSTVSLWWHAAAGRSGAEMWSGMLGCMRQYFPETVPVVYGDVEPLRMKTEVGKENEIAVLWAKHREIKMGSGFFFRSTAPCFSGHVFLSDMRFENWGHRNDLGAYAQFKFNLVFDAEVVADDEPMRERLVEFFIRMAQEIGAFYAEAFVEKGLVYSKRRGLGYTSGTLVHSRAGKHASWWWGIPPVPTWLTWLGKVYVEMKGLFPAEKIFYESGNGFLVRRGELPAFYKELSNTGEAFDSRFHAKVIARPSSIPSEGAAREEILAKLKMQVDSKPMLAQEIPVLE